MSMKTLLGLESFPLKDYELMQKIQEAKNKKLNILELRTKRGKTIKIRINDLYPEGIMKGSYRMYK